MNDEFATALRAAKRLQDEERSRRLPPEEGSPSDTQSILPISIVRDTRGYIEKVTHQVNGCYEKGWFDACAVMMRRLLETLIIEVFEHSKIDHKIKAPTGDFLQLSDLIDRTLAESAWNLSRNTKKALPRLKQVGDWSAHNRRYNAHRQDIDNVKGDLRVSVQELVYLAGLK